MGRLFLGYGRAADDSAFSGGSWQSNLPLNNLKKRRHTQVARSTNANVASTQFTSSILTPISARIVALGPTNLSFSGAWRLTCSNGATIVYSTEWMYPFFETDPADRDPERGVWLAHILPDGMPDANNYKIEVSDASNPAGYFQAGRLMIGTGWQPLYGARYSGNGLSFENRSLSARTLAGNSVFWHRKAPRRFRFSLGRVTKEEAHKDAYRLNREVGFDREVFVAPDVTDENRERIARWFMGTLSTIDALTMTGPDDFDAGYEVAE